MDSRKAESAVALVLEGQRVPVGKRNIVYKLYIKNHYATEALT